METLLQVRIRRISLFDINKHREEMEKVKADLDETRKNLKNLTKYVIGHLEALAGEIRPALSAPDASRSRYDEVDAKEVAFKAFKVAYDRESGYVGLQSFRRRIQSRMHEVRQDAAGVQGWPLQGHRAAGENCSSGRTWFTAACRSANEFSRCAYTNREATYLKRFTFGGTIMNKDYHCIPEKSRILFFEPDTPEGDLHPIQSRAVPEDQSADLRSVGGRSEGPEDARPPDFDQGSRRREQQTAARLGTGSADDEAAVCVAVDCGAVGLARRFLARPGVGFEDFLQYGMLAHLVGVHRARDRLGDLREIDFAGAEGVDRDFIGRVEDGGQCAAHFPCPARQSQRRKTFHIRFFKSEAAEFREVRLHAFAARAIGIGQRILDRQAHVRRGKLRDHRAVDEFDHRMDDALRMHHHADTRPSRCRKASAPRSSPGLC